MTVFQSLTEYYPWFLVLKGRASAFHDFHLDILIEPLARLGRAHPAHS